MTAVQRALCRCVLVALLTTLSLIITAPSEQKPSQVTTAVAPGAHPVIAHIEETP